MKSLSMISKPQTGYTVKKSDAKKAGRFVARHHKDSFKRFMQGRANTDVCYVGFGGMAVPQPRV